MKLEDSREQSPHTTLRATIHRFHRSRNNKMNYFEQHFTLKLNISSTSSNWDINKWHFTESINFEESQMQRTHTKRSTWISVSEKWLGEELKESLRSATSGEDDAEGSTGCRGGTSLLTAAATTVEAIEERENRRSENLVKREKRTVVEGFTLF